MPRDVTISLHVDESLKQRLQDAALESDRSVNDIVNHLLTLAMQLRGDGYILRHDSRLRQTRIESE